MLFDIHGDILTDVTIKRLAGKKHVIRDYHLSRFKKGGQVGGIFVLWIDPPHDEYPEKRFLESIRCIFTELQENQDILQVFDSQSGFNCAIENDKLAIFLGIEGLQAIGDQVEFLYTLYQMGFRHAGLTWNEQNALATGVCGDPECGLTDSGKEAIRIMESLDMILDVSHANDKTFYNIMDVCTKPLIASHSNVRALCDLPRNLKDDQIKLIAQSGGVIGINAFHEFVDLKRENRDVEHLIKHIDYIAEMVGIDHVAFGFDFFEYLSQNTTNSFIHEEYVGTLGLEDISKGEQLQAELEKHGYSREDIEKISYKNFIRLLKP